MGAMHDPAGHDVGHRASVGDPAVVESLVRQFGKHCFDTRAAFLAGEPGFEAPLELIEREARALGDKLVGGRSDRRGWRRPQWELAVLLPDETKHYGTPGAALFMWFANQLLQGAKAAEDGMPEPEVHRRLEPIISDVVTRLQRAKH
ncbi:hypothetical protein ACFPTO_02265 [Paraburkholderia denitrificans]|uniref:Uncharacterized protein n=1 Tax=Paraburkholderia denitrificans TaxID=694025 RepID=A0ABW0J3N6_9BURK